MSQNWSSEVSTPFCVMKRLGQSPIMPPRSTIACTAAVSLRRLSPKPTFAWYSRGFEWVIATGRADRSIASRVVRSPQWDRSISAPTRFISAIALRPKREEMPVSSASQ